MLQNIQGFLSNIWHHLLPRGGSKLHGDHISSLFQEMKDLELRAYLGNVVLCPVDQSHQKLIGVPIKQQACTQYTMACSLQYTHHAALSEKRLQPEEANHSELPTTWLTLMAVAPSWFLQSNQPLTKALCKFSGDFSLADYLLEDFITLKRSLLSGERKAYQWTEH